jgi:hypothetical protein
MRDDLYGLAQIIATTFLVDDRLINLTGSVVAIGEPTEQT